MNNKVICLQCGGSLASLADWREHRDAVDRGEVRYAWCVRYSPPSYVRCAGFLGAR